MLHRFKTVISDIHVYPDNTRQVLETTRGLFFSQGVLLALVEAGMPREEAYAVVQDCAMKAWQENRDFRELVRAREKVRETLSEAQLESCFSYEHHIRHVDTIFERLGIGG
jgi:adenylosuccinate lyase